MINWAKANTHAHEIAPNAQLIEHREVRSQDRQSKVKHEEENGRWQDERPFASQKFLEGG